MWRRKKNKKENDSDSPTDSEDSGSEGTVFVDPVPNRAEEGEQQEEEEEEEQLPEPVAWSDSLLDDDMAELLRHSENETKSKEERPDLEQNRSPAAFKDPLGLIAWVTSSGHADNPTRDGFNPKLFLGQYHRQTNFTDLEKGAKVLQFTVKGQELQLKTFVRDNFSHFISCKDTIDNIYSQIKENELSKEGVGTAKLEQTYRDIMESTDRVFTSLLDRKAEADAKRNTLAVLRRFQFIFGLPAAIREAIKEGEYDKVVRDYKKATNMISGSNVAIFHAVLGEVQGIVSAFQRSLYESLERVGTPINEQETTLRLLMELGVKEDPVWHYLSNLQQYICKVLRQESATSLDTETPLLPSRVQQFEQLCEVLQNYMGPFWVMARRLVDGNHNPRNFSAAHTENDLAALVSELMHLYAARVEGLYFGVDTKIVSETTRAGVEAMQQEKLLVCCLLRCHRFLLSLSMPTAYLRSEAVILARVTDGFVDSVSQLLVTEAARLHEREDWVAIDATSVKTVTQCSLRTTSLPKEFRHLVLATLKLLQGTGISGDPNHKQIQTLCSAFFDGICGFADTIHHLAFVSLNEEGTKLNDNKELNSIDSRLLVQLFNCVFTRTVLLPEITSELVASFPQTEQSFSGRITTITDLFEELEWMIICKYIHHKTLILNSVLREGLETMQWHALAEPQDVSDHVMRMLSLMVCISFELRGSTVTGTVIAKLVENVFQGYLDYLPVLPPTLAALRQCETDVRFVEITCINHLTRTAATLMEAINQHIHTVLPPQRSQDKNPIKAILQATIARTTTMFIPLRAEDGRSMAV